MQPKNIIFNLLVNSKVHTLFFLLGQLPVKKRPKTDFVSDLSPFLAMLCLSFIKSQLKHSNKRVIYTIKKKKMTKIS